MFLRSVLQKQHIPVKNLLSRLPFFTFHATIRLFPSLDTTDYILRLLLPVNSFFIFPKEFI